MTKISPVRSSPDSHKRPKQTKPAFQLLQIWHILRHGYGHVCKHVCRHVSGMCAGMCTDMCTDMSGSPLESFRRGLSKFSVWKPMTKIVAALTTSPGSEKKKRDAAPRKSLSLRTCLYTYLHTHVYTHACTHLSIHMSAHTWLCTCLHTHACTHMPARTWL